MEIIDLEIFLLSRTVENHNDSKNLNWYGKYTSFFWYINYNIKVLSVPMGMIFWYEKLSENPAFSCVLHGLCLKSSIIFSFSGNSFPLTQNVDKVPIEFELLFVHFFVITRVSLGRMDLWNEQYNSHVYRFVISLLDLSLLTEYPIECFGVHFSQWFYSKAFINLRKIQSRIPTGSGPVSEYFPWFPRISFCLLRKPDDKSARNSPVYCSNMQIDIFCLQEKKCRRHYFLYSCILKNPDPLEDVHSSAKV